MKQIHREVLRLDVPEYVKPDLAYIIAEAHYATLRGARGLIQIYGALAKIRRLLKAGL
jgi:replication factor C small subunit